MSRNKQILLIFIVFCLAIVMPLWTGQYYDRLLVLTLIYILVTISFSMYMGFLGGMTLGHVAFFGLGGYVSGLLTVKAGWPTGLGLLSAIGMGTAASVVIGIPALRLVGAYFMLMTVAFHGIVTELSTTLNDLTGGDSGLVGIPDPSFGFIDFNTPQRFYYLALMIVIIVSILLYLLLNSRVGRGWLAIRDNEELANSMGINPFKYKMIGFVVSGVIASTGGWVWAHYVNIMDPVSVFGFDIMFKTAFMGLLGGIGTLVGPFIGAVIIVFVPELFNEHIYHVDEAWRTAALAIFMLAMIIAMPHGVWGYIKAKWARRQFKAIAPAAASPAGTQTSPVSRLTGSVRGLFNNKKTDPK